MAVSNQRFRVWVRLAGFIGLFGHVRTGTLWMKCVSTDTHRWKCGAWRFIWIYCLMLLAVSVADPLFFTFWKFIWKKKKLFLSRNLRRSSFVIVIGRMLHRYFIREPFRLESTSIYEQHTSNKYSNFQNWRWTMKCRVQFTRVMIDEDADDYLDALIIWIFRTITKWNFSQHLDGN